MPVSRGLLGSLETRGVKSIEDAALGQSHKAVADAAAPPRAVVTGVKGPPNTPSGIHPVVSEMAAPPPFHPAGTSDVPLPPSRIPASFHVRDAAGRLIFPSERPMGDAEVGLLAETLGGMLEEWRGRLEENKPDFPLGAARWGVLQMCIYDM